MDKLSKKELRDLERVRFLASAMDPVTNRWYTKDGIAKALGFTRVYVDRLDEVLREYLKGDPMNVPLGAWLSVRASDRRYDIGRAGGGTRFSVTCPQGFTPDDDFRSDVHKVVDSLNARMVE